MDEVSGACEDQRSQIGSCLLCDRHDSLHLRRYKQLTVVSELYRVDAIQLKRRTNERYMVILRSKSKLRAERPTFDGTLQLR